MTIGMNDIQDCEEDSNCSIVPKLDANVTFVRDDFNFVRVLLPLLHPSPPDHPDHVDHVDHGADHDGGAMPCRC